jgi:hypothetical protein
MEETMTKRFGIYILPVLVILALLLTISLPLSPAVAQTDNPNPPEQPVKLIFIHHSTGENWLTDGYGNLGLELGENNYFVSDTNYGWGPDAIGDRTDIPNWEEWFSSPNTPTYMEALISENGQNSGYTRTISDPGGENQVIMFKSCFPNSDLYGNPDDPAGTYGEMTVSGAKYVYNTILRYFGTRPDKLFIVITAPPLSDRTNAANARAFNQWLVNDWLAENNYTLNNVAVFDFYNILTDKDAHHRWNNGVIEHIVGDSNTLAYPSGDDHPSEAGSRKATGEFIPLLNIYYHRWAAGAPVSPPPVVNEPQATISAPEPFTAPLSGGLLVDFEGTPPTLEAFWDEAVASQMSCAVTGNERHNGSAALQIDADVVSGSWGTCQLTFAEPPDLGSGEGISFYIHAGRAGLPYDVDLYAGDPAEPGTYMASLETTPDSVKGWALVGIPWSDFTRVAWEEDAGTAFSTDLEVSAMAFGFNGLDSGNNTGTVWVDDIGLAGAITGNPAEPEEGSTEEESGSSGGLTLPCTGGVIIPLGAFGLFAMLNARTRKSL